VSSEDAISDIESDPLPSVQQTMRFEQIKNVKPKSDIKIIDESKISGIKPTHVEYVDEQFGKFLENKVKRKSLPDSRVHA
jgi:hypothetical protein